MPTYQYACTNPDCGHEFEQFQAFTDPALTECPVCGERVRKVYGSVGVVFKGSGFYRNDSRDSKVTTTAAASDSAKSDSKSDSVKSDSGKSEPKSDTGKSSSSDGGKAGSGGSSGSGSSGSGSSGSGSSGSGSSAGSKAAAK